MKAGPSTATASALKHQLRALSQRNSALSPAREGTARGALWTAFIAVEFYLLSNPLAFQPSFQLSLNQAVEIGLLLALLELPRLRVRRPPLALIVFAAFAAASWWWSMDSVMTVAAFWLYGSVAVLALMIAANVTTRVLVSGFAGGGLLVLGASLYAWQQQVPAALIQHESLDGYLAGVGTNRNILSYTMALALGFLAGYHPKRWSGRAAWLGMVLLLLVGVFLAQSATGFLTAAVVLGLGLGVAGVERKPRILRRRIALTTSAVVIAVCGLVLLFPQLLGVVMSRDSGTLSGRAPLWEAIIHETGSRSAQGYGWGTVWVHPWLPAPDNPVAQDIYAGAGAFMTHGHNSFLDVLPQLGILGVILLLVLHLAPIVTAMTARFRGQRDAETLLHSRVVLISMAAVIMFGVTEPITSTPLGWFCLCLISSMGIKASWGSRSLPGRRRRGRHVAAPGRGWVRGGEVGTLVISAARTAQRDLWTAPRRTAPSDAWSARDIRGRQRGPHAASRPHVDR